MTRHAIPTSFVSRWWETAAVKVAGSDDGLPALREGLELTPSTSSHDNAEKTLERPAESGDGGGDEGGIVPVNMAGGGKPLRYDDVW